MRQPLAVALTAPLISISDASASLFRPRISTLVVVGRDLDVPTGADFVIDELAQLRVLGFADRNENVSSGCPKLRDQMALSLTTFSFGSPISSPRGVRQINPLTVPWRRCFAPA
jgi:hypothetical protein